MIKIRRYFYFLQKSKTRIGIFFSKIKSRPKQKLELFKSNFFEQKVNQNIFKINFYKKEIKRRKLIPEISSSKDNDYFFLKESKKKITKNSS